ncbi:hypothetical protein ACW73L_07545 [Methylolobus aquaticus]
MQRNRHPTSYATRPPSSATGAPGYFHGGDPAQGIPATIPTPEWANGVTETLVRPIEAAGLVLDDDDDMQLLQAIGVIAARQNKALNGQFQYWTAPKPLPAGSSGNLYGPDQWRVQSAGSTFAADTAIFPIGHTAVDGDPRAYLRVTAAAGAGAGGDYVRLSQPIEDCTRFSARTVTVAFDARSAGGTWNLGLSLEQSFGPGGSAPVPGLGGRLFSITPAWQRFVHTINLPSVAGKVLGGSNVVNSYLDLQLWLSAGADLGPLTGGTVGHQSWEFQLTNVRLVIGPSVPPIELRDDRTELAALRRYYEFGGTTAPGGGNWFSGGGITAQVVGASVATIAAPVRYAQQKRVAPTLTLLNPGAANNEVRNLTRGTDCSASGLFRAAGVSAFVAEFTTAAGSAVGDVNGFHWVADARY